MITVEHTSSVPVKQRKLSPAERKAKSRANMTEDQKKKQAKVDAERMARLRAAMTD